MLFLLPLPGSAFTAHFAGPYIVDRKLNETAYVISMPDCRRKNAYVMLICLRLLLDVQRSASIHPPLRLSKTKKPRDPSRQSMHLMNFKMLRQLPTLLSHFGKPNKMMYAA